ncbi:hypothetical protein ACJBU6_08361 [Exserohilum turcicum]
MDVTDIIDYNVSILNPNDPSNACSCLAKHHPTVGFPYHPTRLTGHVHPKTVTDSLGRPNAPDPLHLRLALGSHLAHYLRSRLAAEKGYTATAGISTNKLLSKLVGNTDKPDAQTTLVPPHVSNGSDETADNVTQFLDAYEIGQNPGHRLQNSAEAACICAAATPRLGRWLDRGSRQRRRPGAPCEDASGHGPRRA